MTDDLNEMDQSFDLADMAIVIPTLNAASFAPGLIEAFRTQGIKPEQVYIIDSASTDGSTEMWRQAGCNVHQIARSDFDHGGTRNLGLRMSAPLPLVLFMTQDAVPASDNTFAPLVKPFRDPKAAIVYGRQLPRDGAGMVEAHARLFNYPSVSNRRTAAEARTQGIKAIFNSNSFSCYRRSALEAIGGFPSKVILGEDNIASAKLLAAGWSINYAADACVKHSHGYTMAQEFARYFDIGVFHNEAAVDLRPFRQVGSAGLDFIRAETRFLLSRAPLRIPEALLRTASKFLGYKLGSWHARLPRSAKVQLAWNKGHFRLLTGLDRDMDASGTVQNAMK